MDACTDPAIERVTVMSSAQVGKTELELNVIGRYVHLDPCPILVVLPKQDTAEDWSKDRLAPMFRDTPVLKGRLRPAKTRDSDNKILHKKFPGGHITLVGANSPANLATRPIKVVIFDEVDKFPRSAGKEGDVLKLAEKRTQTYDDRMIISVCTPSTKGESRIEIEFEKSDKRYYYVPCVHCGEHQVLKWKNVKWERDPDGTHHPETAFYVCEHCGVVLNDRDINDMVQAGEWRAKAPFRGIAGFHVWELYSPWGTLEKIVTAFLEAEKDPEALKVFVNTVLGELWEERGESADEHELMKRVEEYTLVPAGAAVLTAGVDVQDNRLEVGVIGHGMFFERWWIDYKVIYGDPAKPAVWNDLDLYLAKTFDSETGEKLKIACACIDSGYKAQEVYHFCSRKGARRIYAVKGIDTPDPSRPIISKPSRVKRYHIDLFSIGVDTAKRYIMARLKISEFGTGYIHFPKADWCNEEFFQQLTAEELISQRRAGSIVKVWKKKRARNEALDVFVYNLAAYEILNPAIETIIDRREKKVSHKQEAAKPQKPAPTPGIARQTVRRKKNWVTNW